jgi:hypothetical protein
MNSAESILSPIQEKLSRWRLQLQQQFKGAPAPPPPLPVANAVRFAQNRSGSAATTPASSASASTDLSAAPAPRTADSTVCPLCFQSLPSDSALLHLAETHGVTTSNRASTNTNTIDNDDDDDDNDWTTVCADSGEFWERLERLHQNGYLAPLVSSTVPTSNVVDSHGVTVAVPEQQRTPQTVSALLSTFRAVLRAKATELKAHADSEAADGAFVTALLAGITVATLEADPRLGQDPVTRSRTLMFAGDESSVYSVGFEFDWIECRGHEFRSVRQRFFDEGASAACELAFVRSLHSGLAGASSAGKSGASFHRSNDGRLLIKTIKAEEFEALLTVSDQWMAHIESNPNTLLVTVLGMYIIQTERTTTHFLVMENVGNGVAAHEILDLKGSTVGRKTSQRADAIDFEVIDDAADCASLKAASVDAPPPLLKDVDVGERRGQILKFGPTLRACFLQQLESDAIFLGQVAALMDFSLLVLVADPAKVALHTSTLAYRPFERSAFRRFNGAVVGSDADDKPLMCCYYLAIIDFAQPYNARKVIERNVKALVHAPGELSVMEPQLYASRFYQRIEELTDPSRTF